MHTIRILANDGIDEKGLAMLQAAGIEVDTDHYPADELADRLRAYDGITVRSATQVRSELIDACPNLKLIGRGGVGMDNIDVSYAKEKGIGVYNTPAASSRSVAELVIAHAFTLMRNLHFGNRMMPESGRTDFGKLKKRCSEGQELSGKTIGIIGFGRIGQEVARIALGLGMNVVAADPYVPSAIIELKISGVADPVAVKIVTVDLDAIFRFSDIITVHIPGATKPLIGIEELSQLKKGVFLINTARGGVFEEQAILAGLESGIIGGAALDVFIGEPHPSREILSHPGISLSPHIGGSTIEAQENVGKELAELIIKHFNLQDHRKA